MHTPIATFLGGPRGPWRIDRITTPSGEALAHAARLDIVPKDLRSRPPGTQWALRGATSHIRYTQATEKADLLASQPPLGRATAHSAALIPIRKSAAWWNLAQDERRAIFEEQSAHIAIGRRYLPVIARQLRHCRDLGEPFDFLTWFEFEPTQTEAFEELLVALRSSAEWSFVEREVDIRLSWDR